MPDLLAHAFIAYSLCRVLSWRFDWLTTPYVTLGMVGAGEGTSPIDGARREATNALSTAAGGERVRFVCLPPGHTERVDFVCLRTPRSGPRRRLPYSGSCAEPDRITERAVADTTSTVSTSTPRSFLTSGVRSKGGQPRVMPGQRQTKRTLSRERAKDWYLTNDRLAGHLSRQTIHTPSLHPGRLCPGNHLHCSYARFRCRATW